MSTLLRLTVLAFLLAALDLSAASVIQLPATLYSVTEGTSQVEINVQRTNDLDTVVSVDFTTTNLSATAGLDYMDVATNLTFGVGETNRTVVVSILNDALVEGTETFQASLSNPTDGAVLGTRTSATVRITDNDKALQLEFARYQVREDEGSVLIGVVRGDDGDFTATVEYATVDGTALAGQDYSDTSGRLEFAGGEKLKLFIIPVLNDGLKEGNETFQLYLTNASAGVTLGTPPSAGITIADNDFGVQIEFNTYWVQENEGTLTLSVLRGNDVDLSAYTVDYATTNLTATAGEDYAETKGTLEFAAGEMVKLLTIPIADDEVVEPDEKFAVTLSNPTGTSVLRSSRATVTILDATGAHRFDGVAVLPDHRVQLTLGGSVYPRIKNYLDLYPIEVSTDLVHWTPFVTLQRTNSSTNVFTYTDSAAATSDLRFYRTFATHLITPFTQPTGPFAVGVISRLVTDPTRRNRYGVSTNCAFMVSIWYPAVTEAGKPPGRLQDDLLSLDPGWWGTSPQVQLTSSALPDAPCAREQAPYPILLHSHGAENLRWDAANKGPCLASHGYVVVSVDHWDAYGTVFPNGTYLHGSTADISPAGFQDRVKDLLLVLDELARWNAIDPVLAGCLDATNVAASGWSWGGGVAAEVCRRDDRCRAAIVLEGYMQNADDLLRSGLSKPSLSMYSDPIGMPGSELLLFNRVTHDAIWFQIRSTTHQDFSDYYWIQDPVGGREVARTINDYILWFLNKYLKGNQDPMPALAEYPRIINFKQK
jgi:dienelactone hydrolase